VGEGTGLGLSTVHGIVTEHGGYIQVKSEPGQGTSFTIYWPSVDEVSQTVSEEAKKTLTRGSETILVVEDDVKIKELFMEMLESQGYRVLCAGSGEEALELFRQSDKSVDLLLTDVMMPGQSGPELHTQLESESPGLKVLFISGYSDKPVEKSKWVGEGMPFLQKPFGASELAVRVREVLGKENIN